MCKYVGTPPGTPDHIIVVSESAIPGFTGTFPFRFFADAQDSIAIRYAVGNEQPGDEELVNCPRGPVDVCPNIPGNQPPGTVCTLPPPVDVCPNIPGNQPKGTDCTPPVREVVVREPDVASVVLGRERELLPATGGLPLWMLLVSGPLVAGGLLVLMRRRPVVHAFSGAGGPSYSLSLPPVKKPLPTVETAPTARGFLATIAAKVIGFFRGGRR